MPTKNPTRTKDKEVQARAKMAAFIDHVIDIIESTPKDNQVAAKQHSKLNRHPEARPTAD
jgi:hypothetical protein